MTSLFASSLLWDFWVISWIVAAVWTRRTLARPRLRDSAAYLIPTLVGAFLLFFGSSPRVGLFGGEPLWRLPASASWAATGAVAAGISFMWWARLTLGDLWSGSVTRKQDHALVERGPYRLVRHPIYTGFILAAFALAIQIGMVANLVGAALVTLGIWLKARLEEHFLGARLGEAAYAAYRRRTPMIVPFWPMGR